MQYCVEGFEANCWGSSFVVVNTITLGKAFSYIANFVSHDAAGVVTFAFTHEFATEGSLTAGDIRTGNKDEYFKVLQALQFVLTPCYPILTFVGSHCLCPSGFILISRRGLKGAITEGG